MYALRSYLYAVRKVPFGLSPEKKCKKKESSPLATNSFWGVAPLLMSTRSPGIPSVPPVDVCKGVGEGCMCLCARGCFQPKLQEMTSQCDGTGLMSYRSYRSVRYRKYRRYASVRTVPNTPLAPRIHAGKDTHSPVQHPCKHLPVVRSV